MNRIAVFYLMLSVTVAGCETTRFDPPPERLRQQLGDTALIVTYDKSLFVPPPEPEFVGSSNGAAEGARRGAMVAVAPVMENPVWVLAAVQLLPLAALAGAAIGSAAAGSEEDVKAADTAFQAFLNMERPDHALSSRLTREIRATGYARAIDVRSEADGTSVHMGSDAPYQHLIEAGYDSSIRIFIRNQFEKRGEISPQITLTIRVEARIIPLGFEASQYHRLWHYRGDPMPYFAISDNDGTLLHDAFNEAYAALSMVIAHDLLVASKPERNGQVHPKVTTTLVWQETPNAR